MTSLVRRTEGELLVKRIRDNMWERNISAEMVAKKAKIGKTTLYAYFKNPGSAPLDKLMRICRVVGIQQVTLMTGATY
ncbi:MAG: helix-turn-helix transcriptional regulator [Ruminococcaceae bacterium]|nr:helix-turn-helix transcriptional regulator [Oscillospiraceae bacterium]